MRRAWLSAGVFVFLSGCSGLFETDTPPIQAYVLRANSGTTESAASLEPIKGVLRVTHPLAAPGLESERIVLVQSDHRLSYFTASRWASNVPDVVESLAVETLRGSQQWSVVTGSNSGFPGDYTLQITVRRFDADYSQESGGQKSSAPLVHVALDCVIARRADRELLGSFTAEAQEQSTENRLALVVDAFEKATNRALATVAQRSAEAVRTSKVPSSP